MDKILQKYEIRKSNKQKTEFINYLTKRVVGYGYNLEDIKIEERFKSIFKTRNIVIGNPDEAEIYLTAHYDTCAVSFMPNFMFPTNPFLYIFSQIVVTVLVCFFAWCFMIPFALFVENSDACVYSFSFAIYLMWFQLSFGIRNKHNANDNTSGVLTLLYILKKLPQDMRSKVCVVFFDNEEKGLFGSTYFAKKHPRAQEKILINFDCVGDGNNVLTVSKRKARKSEQYELLNECLEKNIKNKKIQYVKRKAFPLRLPSDQVNFKMSVGVATLKKKWFGRYCARIHTRFDTKCDINNIKYLSNSIVEFIKKAYNT
jgi:hypothetical protein